MATPTKDPSTVRSKCSETPKKSENHNPNLLSPDSKPSSSPSIKSAKADKSAPKSRNPNPNPVYASPRYKIKERRFVVARKKNPTNLASNFNCKCKEKTNGKCVCVAYENLRASQEEFFKTRNADEADQNKCDLEEELAKLEIADMNSVVEASNGQKIISVTGGEEGGIESDVTENDCLGSNPDSAHYEPEAAESPTGVGSSTIKRRRDKLMEEARESVPDPGSGRVMHLVHAFEKLLSFPKADPNGKKDEKKLEDTKKVMRWALPGLQRPKAPATEISSSSSSFCPGELVFNAESLGLASCVSTSLDSSRESISSRSTAGTRGNRRSSSVSSGSVGRKKWKKKQVRVTSAKPFKLRTEQRGKTKEEEFFRKLQEMMIEEEKQRIPIAQGLPWTTDEPECLTKPPLRESTRPIDLKLHTDMRAVERAEFDQQVAEKLTLIEQYKMEKERQQKLAEEEEIRRLRKVLVPKAQPMPYFDRPFVPRRSSKHPTRPKEPKFHLPEHKKIKSCQSWNDLCVYTQHQ